MKGLYKMSIDCGRQGYLDGIFISDTDAMDDLISSGKEVYFGEVLGKHSEVYGAIEKEDITLVTTETKVIEIFEEYDLSSGFNPFDYIDEDEEE